MTSNIVSLIKETARHKNLGLHIIIEKKSDFSVGTGAGGDAAGKAFEIHVAKHIGHILKGGDNPEEHYPEHFSDESGDSPTESLKKQKDRLGEHHHDIIEKHARRMAHHIINHLKKRGVTLDHTSKVTWTSKPKDLERLTGVKGVKGTSDITVSHGKNHYGFSLKYTASGSKPSLRSPGIKDLNGMLNADHDRVDDIVKKNKTSVDMQMKKHVGTGSMKEKHQRFKSLLALNSTHPGHIAAKRALETTKSMHRELAGHYTESFNKLSHEHKTSFIRKMIDAEEQPTIKPFRAGYDGSKGESYVSNPTEDFDKIHKNTHEYRAEQSGASVNIYAHHHDGTRTKITSFGIKNKSSSPYSGLGGRVGDTSIKKSVIKRKKKIVKKSK